MNHAKYPIINRMNRIISMRCRERFFPLIVTVLFHKSNFIDQTSSTYLTISEKIFMKYTWDVPHAIPNATGAAIKKSQSAASNSSNISFMIVSSLIDRITSQYKNIYIFSTEIQFSYRSEI